MRSGLRRGLSGARVVLGVLVAVLWCLPALGCTSVFVGKGASATGHVMIARNEDYRGGWAKHFRVVPSRPVAKGEKQVFWSGMELGYPEGMTRTYRYFSVPDWPYDPSVDPRDPSQEYTPMDEVGINEKGVAVSATESQEISPEAQKVTPLDGLIDESQIPSIILPRASTAREGVRIFGEAIEAFGSSEAGGFAVADPNEVWYVEFHGRVWAACRIPDDSYTVVPNQKVISNFNPYDGENFMGSPSLLELVKNSGLLPKEECTEEHVRAKGLDLAKAFGVLDWTYNGVRMWWGHRHFSPSKVQEPGRDSYPFLMTPDRKITKLDVMEFLRSDNYPFTGYENPVNGVKGKVRPVAVRRTVESHLVELGGVDGVSGDVGNVLWLSLGNPTGSVYMPFCQGLTRLPNSFTLGTDQPEAHSPYWSFYGASRKAQAHDDANGTDLEGAIKAYWRDYQVELIRSFEAFQAGARKLKGEDLAPLLNHQAAVYSWRIVKAARGLQAELHRAISTNGEFRPVFKPDQVPRPEEVLGYPR